MLSDVLLVREKNIIPITTNPNTNFFFILLPQRCTVLAEIVPINKGIGEFLTTHIGLVRLHKSNKQQAEQIR